VSETDELADAMASARVLHLQPDDQIVIEMDRPLTEVLAHRIRDAFEGRRVVVLDQGIRLRLADPERCATCGHSTA